MGLGGRLLACVLLALVAADCRESGRVASNVVRRGVRIGPVIRFRPPADGLLTSAQLDLYIRVRRAARGRPDEDALQEVGADPEQFAWVRARILEALVTLDTRRVRTASEESYVRTIAALNETRKSVQDRDTLRTLDAQIAGLEKERTSWRPLEPFPPATAANAALIAARRAEIEAVSP
ncbi:MAG TPA: hypothetical protein VLO07_05365 [Thermoanaerobaculia bacterium]|nr:hypothetical protein [Thermoanaerobaculia bacterium]